MIRGGRKNKALIRNVVFGCLSFALVGGLTALFMSNPFNTKAASLANFNPGNIISDYMMSNVDTMSLNDIQRFLDEHGNCNDTDIYVADWYPSMRYHIKDGHFVCMAQERFGDGVLYGDDLKDGEGQTAAEIIYEVAHEYQINPQVLIALLEKEQGLVSDSWPNAGQYGTATGFGCPDNAACDSQYFGLKNQLRSAADLFRTVLDGGWTNYPVGENYVAYNPNSACGGSVINIENRATSALYRYTPYQPNQGAIDAVYGTSYCGSYGNRNFYLYLSDWFGIQDSEFVTDDNVVAGTYQIVSSYDKTKALDVSGGIFEQNRNIQVFNRWKGNLSQEWELVSIKDDEYAIVNPTSGLVLGIEGGSANEGSNIALDEWSNSCSQRWVFLRKGEGYKIQSACNKGMVIDLQDYNTNAQVYFVWGDNNLAQVWKFSKIGYESEKYSSYAQTPENNNEKIVDNASDSKANSEFVESSKPEPNDVVDNEIDFTNGSYSIRPLFNNKLAIDVDYARTENMTNIKVFESSDKNQAQEWKIESHGDYYVIRNPMSNKVLDVANGALSNNSNVWLYEYNDSCAQRWAISKRESGGYIIQNACNSNLVLDVQDSITNVQIYTRWGDDNMAQIWEFVRY